MTLFVSGSFVAQESESKPKIDIDSVVRPTYSFDVKLSTEIKEFKKKNVKSIYNNNAYSPRYSILLGEDMYEMSDEQTLAFFKFYEKQNEVRIWYNSLSNLPRQRRHSDSLQTEPERVPDSTKYIVDYKCNKYIVKNSDGSRIEYWATSEIELNKDLLLNINRNCNTTLGINNIDELDMMVLQSFYYDKDGFLKTLRTVTSFEQEKYIKEMKDYTILIMPNY